MSGPPDSSGHGRVDIPRNAWPRIQNKVTRAARVLVFVSLLSLSPSAFGQRQIEAPDVRAQEPGATPSILFVENVGQTDPLSLYTAQAVGGTIHLAQDALWITLTDPLPESLSDDPADRPPLDGVHLRLSFTDANPKAVIVPFGAQETKVSFLRGPNEGSGSQTSVPVWSGVRYEELYPGVDLEVSSDAGEWAWRLIDKNAPITTRRPPGRGPTTRLRWLPARPPKARRSRCRSRARRAWAWPTIRSRSPPL